MSETMPDPVFPITCPVKADRIPATGQIITLSPGPAERAALARAAGIMAIAALDAHLTAEREGARVRVRGEVRADVTQACVITLDPVEATVIQPVHLVFAPQAEADAAARAAGLPPDIDADSFDPAGIDMARLETMLLDDPDQVPDPIVDGVIDFGAIVSEALILGLDPYPRKPGATFVEPDPATQSDSPFAALSALRAGTGSST